MQATASGGSGVSCRSFSSLVAANTCWASNQGAGGGLGGVTQRSAVFVVHTMHTQGNEYQKLKHTA